MGRAPCCEKTGLKKGPWTAEEDKILVNYIQKNGHGSWRALPKLAGLLRCGKSCRLRWTNYLKPDIRRGSFTEEEERTIIRLHAILGNRWSVIASQLFGRTDNEIKNFWNTHLKKRLLKMGIDPSTHAPRTDANDPGPQGLKVLTLTRHKAQWENARLEAEARLSRESLLMSSISASSYRTNKPITMPEDNAPTDYFLRIWNSEAGKAFRKECSIIKKSCNSSCHIFDLNHQNRGQDYEVSYSDTLKTPVSPGLASSSLYCASTQHSCYWSLNPDDKDKDNDSQRCNSASAEWIGDCSVKTPDVLSCSADITTGQTERKVHEDSSTSAELGTSHVYYTDFSDLLLDYPDNNNNSGNIGCMTPELSTSFQQRSAWPWSELNLEDSKDH
eukprot:PITA_18542